MVKSLILLFSVLIVVVSCSDDTTTSPVYPPEITAKINGDVEVDFKSSAFFFRVNEDSVKITTVSGTMYSGLEYTMYLHFYVKDSIVPGNYKMTMFPDTCSGDCVLGALSVSGDQGEEIYLSTSGQVDLTIYDGRSMEGTFYFDAVLQGGTKSILVTNGILKVFNF